MDEIWSSDTPGRVPTVNQLLLARKNLGYNRRDAKWYGLKIAGSTKTVELLNGSGGGTGVDGQNAYLYVSYALDANGTAWSLTPLPGLKYRAEIQTIAELTPVQSDFALATWVKYIGDDGAEGPQGPPGPADTLWQRNGTTLSPITDGDKIQTSGHIESNGATGFVRLMNGRSLRHETGDCNDSNARISATELLLGDVLYGKNINLYKGATYHNVFQEGVDAAENWTPASRATRWVIRTVKTGETVCANRLLVDGDGAVLIGAFPIRETAISSTLLAEDTIVINTASGVGIIITLPAASDKKGKMYYIDNTDTGSNLQVICSGSDTIQGNATASILPNSCMTVYSNGANWRIISQAAAGSTGLTQQQTEGLL